MTTHLVGFTWSDKSGTLHHTLMLNSETTDPVGTQYNLDTDDLDTYGSTFVDTAKNWLYIASNDTGTLQLHSVFVSKYSRTMDCCNY